MTYFITLGLVDTIADPTVELIKKKLAGETTIRRAVSHGQPNVDALYDQPTATDPGVFSGVLLMLVEAMLMLMLLPVVMMSMLMIKKK